MRSVIVLCLIIGLALASNLDVKSQWESFKAKYGKSYSVGEEVYRYNVFQHNLRKAAELQKKEGPHGARHGVTKFSDLTEDEFRSKYLMPKGIADTYKPIDAVPYQEPKPNKLGIKPDPTNFNWFTQATPPVCTPVLNQGACGSCWAFSATETIESYWALAGNPLAGLSEEQIVDCCSQAFGCGGGWPYWAYAYVISTKGVDSNSSYPYTAEGGVSGTCAFNAADVVATITGYTNITGETGLYKQTSTAGPVSVCVDASSWSSYTGGVLTQCTTYVDHCVQLVGYANYGQTGAYWVVRNSWGADWGENGFIWIEIGQDLCLIGDYATSVIVA